MCKASQVLRLIFKRIFSLGGKQTLPLIRSLVHFWSREEKGCLCISL